MKTVLNEQDVEKSHTPLRTLEDFKQLMRRVDDVLDENREFIAFLEAKRAQEEALRSD